MPSERTPRSLAPRSFVLSLLSAAVLYGALAAYSFHPRLPFNTVRLPGEGSQLEPQAFPLQFVLPQGWKFFTKSPRGNEVKVFMQGAGRRWEPVSPRTLSDAGGLFNFDRTPRALGVELAMVLQNAKKDEWSAECRDTDVTCLQKSSAARTLQNPMPKARLCGVVGFVSRPPVPFAWADSLKAPMPSNTLVLRIQCAS